jgi:ribA/ribD-fused uncharacterized protein
MSGFKFSNFQPSPITLRGTTWSTVEHFYQAMKSEDPVEQRKIRKLEKPGQAKRAGRKVTMRKDWEKIKESIMMEALRAKFAIPDFKQSLLSEEGEIVEWNKWHDNEWGSCLCAKCRHKEGRNKLGKLLMQLREELS